MNEGGLDRPEGGRGRKVLLASRERPSGGRAVEGTRGRGTKGGQQRKVIEPPLPFLISAGKERRSVESRSGSTGKKKTGG